MRVAPGVEGAVVDQTSGQPIEGALVVVRFDGHYDEILPDREVLGHREARTDANGRFEIGALVEPGISAWPSFRTEARVVAVMSDGYRCPPPQPASSSESVRIAMRRALDENDRRDSCRPVPAEKDEAVGYMTAWRALYPKVEQRPDSEDAQQLDRLLAARAAFGFGENCEGPALDLALAPDGRRVAYSIAGARAPEVRIVELRGDRSQVVEVIPLEPRASARRLAWASATDLVLWEAVSDSNLVASPSIFASGQFERIWSAAGPASISSEPASAAGSADGLDDGDTASAIARARSRDRDPAPVFVPEDLNDERDSRWRGRSFVLEQRPNPDTGLPQDDLRVYREDATSYTLALPGEVCGPPGRFGRPQYRIAADGRTSLDLRFVNGGCHVVRTDLEDGSWSALDDVARAGVCRAARRIQATEFRTALRGYTGELESAIFDAGADPAAAYSLEIAADGTTRLATREFSGRALTIAVPRFPIGTPLRKIEVSTLGAGANAIGITNTSGSAARPTLEPL
ncbi:MAG TPA: carboxypeptidase-like regulatory domain-containing protein [Myxococcota bacterium]|nr:carboxypeptidase-like regulatory domain-containing protein [Myxococcota bacterium]